jgi:hypothetical protein
MVLKANTLEIKILWKIQVEEATLKMDLVILIGKAKMTNKEKMACLKVTAAQISI